ncbi:pentapeptide repeat protein [Streptomyces sp. TLI_235]|nr:pentapeptide repeat-containing protein [Streptomyces sp. TLI_235]PBC76731.1 pentapeptide repeat protein [Streptomyces sp. TLI_235]
MTENDPPALRPNLLALRPDLTSSTLAGAEAAHSLVSESNFFNSLFHSCNLQGITFESSELDGSLFEGCSFRGVELRNCDLDGLIVNGVRVGALLRAFLAPEGAVHVDG